MTLIYVAILTTTLTALAEPQPLSKEEYQLPPDAVQACAFQLDHIGEFVIIPSSEESYAYVGGGAYARGPTRKETASVHVALPSKEVLVDAQTGSCKDVPAGSGQTLQKIIESRLDLLIRVYEIRSQMLLKGDSDAPTRDRLKAFNDFIDQSIQRCVGGGRSSPKPVPKWLSDKTFEVRQRVIRQNQALVLGAPAKGTDAAP